VTDSSTPLAAAYEKLGLFYLGRELERASPSTQAPTPTPHPPPPHTKTPHHT